MYPTENIEPPFLDETKLSLKKNEKIQGHTKREPNKEGYYENLERITMKILYEV